MLRNLIGILGYCFFGFVVLLTFVACMVLATIPSPATHVAGDCDQPLGWCDCQYQPDADHLWKERN